MTTMWPMPAAVVPDAANACSRIETRHPSRANASPHAAPTIPAPTTIASDVAGIVSRRCRSEMDRRGRSEASNRR